MGKRQELRNEISQIWFIFLYAKECFQLSYYLHKPDSVQENEFLNNSEIFSFIRHSFWRLTVIELSKLFSNSKKRDKYNLNHFISKFQNNGYYGKLGMNKEYIESWNILLVENKKIIGVILDLRDKIYGHTDPNQEILKNSDITFEQTKELLDVIEKIIKEIFIEVFDAEPLTSHNLFGTDNITFVKILAEEKEKWVNDVVKKFKDKDDCS